MPASPPAWDAIRAGTATEPGAKKQAARMPAVVDALKKAGVDAGDVLLAWDFVTASDESLTAPTLSVGVPNTAHDTLRALPRLEAQIDVFFRTGDVTHTCDGVCDPE